MIARVRHALVVVVLLAITFAIGGGAMEVLRVGAGTASWFGAIMTTLLAIIGGGLLGIACLRSIELGRSRLLMSIGLLAAAITIACLLRATWRSSWPTNRAHDTAYLVSIIPGAVAIAITMIGIMLSIRPTGRAVRISRAVTVLLIVVTGLVVAGGVAIGMSLGLSTRGGEAWLGGTGAFGVFGALILTASTGITAALASASTIGSTPGATAERLPFEMVCPRCERRQHLTTGGASCAGCGLIVRVQPT